MQGIFFKVMPDNFEKRMQILKKMIATKDAKNAALITISNQKDDQIALLETQLKQLRRGMVLTQQHNDEDEMQEDNLLEEETSGVVDDQFDEDLWAHTPANNTIMKKEPNNDAEKSLPAFR